MTQADSIYTVHASVNRRQENKRQENERQENERQKKQEAEDGGCTANQVFYIPPHRPGILSAYVGKITRNLAIDSIRKKNVAKRAAPHIFSIEQEMLFRILKAEGRI